MKVLFASPLSLCLFVVLFGCGKPSQSAPASDPAQPEALSNQAIMVPAQPAVQLASLASYSGKYTDAYQLTVRFTGIVEQYATDLEKVNTADELVAAMETFHRSITEMYPSLQEMEARYPELADESERIREFVELENRTDAASDRISQNMMKVMTHAADPKVRAFLEKLEDIDID